VDDKPPLSELLRGDTSTQERRAEALVSELTSDERAKGFRLLIASRLGSDILLEDMGGEYRRWDDLGPAGRLAVIAADAAFYEVTFEVFQAAALELVGEELLLAAALMTTFTDQRELMAIARMLPDDGVLVPLPLADRVRELVQDLDHAEQRLAVEPPEPIKALFEEWTADYAAARERYGKPTLDDILNGKAVEQPKPDKQQDRGIERG
jgi:hypothetical protein